MAAKRKAFALFGALVSLLIASPAFASIPRSTLLDPPRLAIELDAPADVAQDERETPLHRALATALDAPEPIAHEPLDTNLRRALARALPASEPLASLAETRVRASDFFAPLLHQPPEPLSRALHQAYARLNPESASDRLFVGGDPVNGRDPLGLGEEESFKAGLALGRDPQVQAAMDRLFRRVKRFARHQWENAKAVVYVNSLAPSNLALEGSPEVQEASEHLAVIGRESGRQIHNAAANWGTSAGQLIDDPNLIYAPIQELSEEEIDEAFDDATDLTMILVTPLRNVGGPKVPPVRVSTGAPTVAAPQPPGRPTWRASELNAASELDGLGFVEQRSFLNGKEVPYGTPGSVRPDFASDTWFMSVDVKNYNVATPQGRYSLVQNVMEQVATRGKHLPPGYRQGLIIDARGQSVKPQLLNAMANRIVKKTSGGIGRENIYILGLD